MNSQESVWSISYLENEAAHPNDVSGTDFTPTRPRGSACLPMAGPAEPQHSTKPASLGHTVTEAPPELSVAKATRGGFFIKDPRARKGLREEKV